MITGLYILMISLTGSVLVYRNELYQLFSPQPVIVTSSGIPLSESALSDAVLQRYRGYAIERVQVGATPNHAIEITLSRDGEEMRRLFHPFTGADLGHPVPAGFRVTQWLLDLHDNLLSGDEGRRLNGVGAIGVILLCITGAVIWWPGTKRWRHGLSVNFKAGRAQVIFRLHKALGFWFFAFLLMWGVSGAYFAFQEEFTALFDYLDPFDPDNPQERVVDKIQYWLAYLHFGRLGGRGIPWCDRGLCNSITMATWAISALIPPVIFVTGALMWKKRVLDPWVSRFSRSVRRNGAPCLQESETRNEI